jgi:hypothetical protein
MGVGSSAERTGWAGRCLRLRGLQMMRMCVRARVGVHGRLDGGGFGVGGGASA